MLKYNPGRHTQLTPVSDLYGLLGTFVDGGFIQSGQIIATSHDLTPNGGLVREIPLFQGNLGW